MLLQGSRSLKTRMFNFHYPPERRKFVFGKNEQAKYTFLPFMLMEDKFFFLSGTNHHDDKDLKTGTVTGQLE